MDSQYAVDASSHSIGGSLTASKTILINSIRFNPSFTPIPKDKNLKQKNIINGDLNARKKIAKISIISLLGIGITELVVGYCGGGTVTTAHGINTFSYALISFIVLFGLRIAHRPPNKKFQYGYYKVESFATLMAAIGMISMGLIILYNSYHAFIYPQEIKQPFLSMLVLAAAGVISLLRTVQMKKIVNKYNIVSFMADTKNLIKNSSAFLIGFICVVIATQFGFLQIDAIGGIVIAVYIFSVSFVPLKKSTSILVDSCLDSNLSDKLKKMIIERFNDEIINVKSVLIRPAGMAMHAEIHVEIDGKKKFREVGLLLNDIEIVLFSKFQNLATVTILPYSSKEIPSYYYHQENVIHKSITIK